jgi:hypothetical protein
LEQQAALDEIARLEAYVGGDPGASAFPALAEANRRAGRVKVAEHVAREGLRERPGLLAGRVALSLALLDLGRIDEARNELMHVLDSNPDHPLAVDALKRAAPEAPAESEAGDESDGPLIDLADDELESAFRDAEAQPDEMLSEGDVVAAAVRAVDHDEPEGVGAFSADSPFATETVASLLEEQDHGAEARAMREALRSPASAATLDTEPGASLPDAVNHRARVIATLERWLENLRRGSR